MVWKQVEDTATAQGFAIEWKINSKAFAISILTASSFIVDNITVRIGMYIENALEFISIL